MGQGRMSICQSIGHMSCVGNLCPIGHRLRDIHSQNVLALTLTFRMGQGRMPICQSKGHVRISMLWQIEMFAVSIIV